MRLHLRLIRLISRIVPSRFRSDWQQEWEAELQHRESSLQRWQRLDWRGRSSLIHHSVGAFWDALAMQPRRLEEEFFRDVRYAIRLMLKKPIFTAAMVLTLGVCIGAVTAVFSVVDGVLLRPLPYPEPGQLAQLAIRYDFAGGTDFQLPQNGATWERFSRASHGMDFAAYRQGTENLNFSSGGEAGYVRRQRVSAGFFRVFGIYPGIGREFTAEEDVPGGPPVAVLSHNLWQRAFGADPSIIGRQVPIAGVDYRVVGVAAAQFESKADLWTPLRPSTVGEGQGINYQIVGRLRGPTIWYQADAEMASIGGPMLEGNVRRGVTARYTLTSLQDAPARRRRFSLDRVGGHDPRSCHQLCERCGNAPLSERVAHRRDRHSHGDRRKSIRNHPPVDERKPRDQHRGKRSGTGRRVFRVGMDWGILPSSFTALQNARLDFRVLAVVGAVTLMSTMLFGLLPALQASRVDIRTAQSQRAVLHPRRPFIRRALSTVQVAIAVVVLIGAGLLVRSFAYLSNLEPGLDATNVITANFALLDERYSNTEAAGRYFDEVLRRLRQVPGVEAAAVAHSLPYERGMNVVVNRPGDSGRGSARLTNWTYVSPQFFEALRVRVLRGRPIMETDRTGSAGVVVVNDAFAKLYFKDQDALGAQLRIFGQEREVVGIVGDVLQQAGWGNYGPMGRVPTIYVPAAQPGLAALLAPSPSWIVRTSGPQSGIQTQIEQAVRSVDPMLPVAAFESLNDINLRSLGQQRFIATLLTIAAALSLLLASIGTFAMISNSVAERSREFGIRLALGATINRTIGDCARSGLICTAIGLTAGLVLARMGTRFLQGMIYGITAADEATYVCVVAGIFVVAAIASVVPALRIARLDPARILRHE